MNVPASTVSVGGSEPGTALQQLLLAQDIQPGSQPSYELCKLIWRYHPLGGKIADAPIKLAQTKPRVTQVDGAPTEVHDAYVEASKAIATDYQVRCVAILKRVYGVSALLVVFKSEQDKPERWAEPLDPARFATEEFEFNHLDPLNASGSLVLNQDPNSILYQKPGQYITAGGRPHHMSRAVVQFNEQPVYIEYQSAAFGFSGVSCYQRALYPLKSFIQTMVTDDMVSRKAGIIVAAIRAGGSIVNQVMQAVAGVKRALLRIAATNNVISIEPDERIESINLEHVDKAMGAARSNIVKNISTAVPMPARILEDEALAQGFGEGTEDAKFIVNYADEVRKELEPWYAFCDMVAQRKAWTPEFFARMQELYPDEYGAMTFEQAFFAWRKGFKFEWPNLLTEPDSEKAKQDKAKLEGLVSLYTTLVADLDPENKSRMTQWLVNNANEYRHLFPEAIDLDLDLLLEWYKERQKRTDKQTDEAQFRDDGKIERIN